MKVPNGVQSQVSLKPWTSWQVGGVADWWVQPSSPEELREVLRWAQSMNLPVHVLGGGSNVLVSDSGVDGLVIGTQRLNQLEIKESPEGLWIKAQAGVKKSELLKIFLRYQLPPALFLAGLPGDVGGGVVMNAGVSEDLRPREFGELVHSIRVMGMEGEIREIPQESLVWRYRKSSGWQPGIVLEATLFWPWEKTPDVLPRVKELNRLRLQKQPLDLPSCGSVFKNPAGLKAARLIDEAGLKGYRVGDAQVSAKHANFIVNLGNASAQDIHQIIEHVRQVVYQRTGVQLESEVVYFGRW